MLFIALLLSDPLFCSAGSVGAESMVGLFVYFSPSVRRLPCSASFVGPLRRRPCQVAFFFRPGPIVCPALVASLPGLSSSLRSSRPGLCFGRAVLVLWFCPFLLPSFLGGYALFPVCVLPFGFSFPLVWLPFWCSVIFAFLSLHWSGISLLLFLDFCCIRPVPLPCPLCFHVSVDVNLPSHILFYCVARPLALTSSTSWIFTWCASWCGARVASRRASAHPFFRHAIAWPCFGDGAFRRVVCFAAASFLPALRSFSPLPPSAFWSAPGVCGDIA